MMWCMSQKNMKYKLLVKKSAAGLGLFAGENIPRETRVIEYVGERISADEANRRGGKYLFEVTDTVTIDGKERSNTARYINHACQPNGEMQNHNNRIFYYTKRAILQGEELTFDYGQEYFDELIAPHGCRCGSKKHHKNNKISPELA